MAFDKRGQEGLTLTTLLLIVLGIVVVVVVIIGFTTGFDFIFGKVEQLPGQSLQVAVEACSLAANNNLKADYCLEFREVEIDGVTQYITCENAALKGLYENTVSKVTCTGLEVNVSSLCVSNKLKDSVFVTVGESNKKTCKVWNVPSDKIKLL